MREFKKVCWFFFPTFISEDVFNGVCMCLCTGVMRRYLLIIFSSFRIIKPPRELKIKTDIHVNLCISEKTAITVYYPHSRFSQLPSLCICSCLSLYSLWRPLVLPLSLVKPFNYYLGRGHQRLSGLLPWCQIDYIVCLRAS